MLHMPGLGEVLSARSSNEDVAEQAAASGNVRVARSATEHAPNMSTATRDRLRGQALVRRYQKGFPTTPPTAQVPAVDKRS